jgi:hypothetical protein
VLSDEDDEDDEDEDNDGDVPMSSRQISLDAEQTSKLSLICCFAEFFGFHRQAAEIVFFFGVSF